MDVLFEVAALPEGEGIQWPPFNHILLKRIIESGFISIQEQEGHVILGGMRANPDIIAITPKGRAFIADLGVSEL